MMKYRDTASQLFWLIIDLGFSIWVLTSYKVGSLTQPGPGFLPLALGIIMILLSLILFVDQMKKTPDAGKASAHRSLPDHFPHLFRNYKEEKKLIAENG